MGSRAVFGIKRTGLLGAAAVLGFGLLTACGSAPRSAAPPKPQHWSTPPAMSINPAKSYTAIVKTSLGTFDISLFAKQDPLAVNNFVFLARHHFYNNLKIFRIVPSFVFQTGDPKNDGQGGPGYYVKDELPPTVPYGPGVVAYANNGPNHNGSQFFVCTGSASANLSQDPAFTEIGQVTKSTMAVVQKIGSVKVEYNAAFQEKSKPVTPVTMISVTIKES